ncbi:MAG TPA: ABC transporter substrate-binding protein [Clostridiales bacterium]|nr:ABC transporter substrate-binding protein [Clostridiales bacterium]
MKEKIYTIPVTDAFRQDCECPLCVLEKDLEDRAVQFVLGPSLMEPDKRDDTTEKGFCRRHFTKLFNARENILGLSLIINSHLEHVTDLIEKASPKSIGKGKRKLFDKSQSVQGAQKTVGVLDRLESTCEVCDRIDSTMDRYLEVILYLYGKEDEFRRMFKEHKGFCLPHLNMLLKSTGKYMRGEKAEEFISVVLNIEVENLKRIYGDMDWFIKKFDYRYQNEPWKNSQDAVQRTIEKLVKYTELD